MGHFLRDSNTEVSPSTVRDNDPADQFRLWQWHNSKFINELEIFANFCPIGLVEVLLFLVYLKSELTSNGICLGFTLHHWISKSVNLFLTYEIAYCNFCLALIKKKLHKTGLSLKTVVCRNKRPRSHISHMSHICPQLNIFPVNMNLITFHGFNLSDFHKLEVSDV
jgi:hypothetical protein